MMWLSILVTVLSAGPALCASGVELLLEQSPSNAGTITPGTGVHYFESDTELTITAIPLEGYVFAYWLGDVSDPASSTTQVHLNDSKAVVAVYEPVAVSPSNDDEEPIRFGGGGGAGHLLPTAANFFTSGFSAPGGGAGTTQVIQYQIIAPAPVPEPATLVLLGLGSLALARRNRKNRPTRR